MDKTNCPTFVAPEMSKLQWLNVFLTERLTAAAMEIFGAVEKTILEYQEEIIRLRQENSRLRSNNAVIQPEKLPPDPQQQQLTVSVSEDVLLDLKEQSQRWSPSLGQEDPEPTQSQTEKEQDPRTSQEEAQLQQLEFDIILTPVYHVENGFEQEQPQPLHLDLPQTATQIKSEANEVKCNTDCTSWEKLGQDGYKYPNTQPHPTIPPAHHGLDSPATPPAEVSNAQIYRAVMNLSHTTARVKDDLNCVVGGLKLEIGGLKKEVGGLKEHVVSLRDSLERDVHQLGPVPAKRKRARSSLVAETVRRLHNSVVNLVHRYQPKDKVNSPHNKMVSAYLIREASKESLGVTHDVLRAASVTYYETVRRNFLMQLPENRKKSEDTRIDKRWRSRRKRLLDSRTAMLQSHEEKDLWEGVTSELMSDEEDTMVDDKLVWLVKPPAFRSMELSELCAVLQNRLDKHPKTKALPRTPRLPSGLMSMREPPRTFHQDRHAQADLIEERTPLMPSAGDNQRFNSPGVTLLTVKEEEEMD